jgi:glycosyltransferase involved in cell wall biosynthesis
LYREFLEYAAQKFPGQYWQATPKELVDWFQPISRVNDLRTSPAEKPRQLQGKKAAVLLYSYYPSDPRPKREAEALASSGMEVDLLCLRQNEQEPATETINGVNVRRVPMPRRRDSKLTYLRQYAFFICWSAAVLAGRSFRKKYDLVHVHNMPDVLVFSGLVPKLRGARIILDQHDPMPELMMSIFGLSERSAGVRIMKWLEKLSIRFANQVVTVNQCCKKIFSSRSCLPEKVQVVMNSPDEGIFAFRRYQEPPVRDPARPFILMYHGSIVERHGLDLAVEALAVARQTIPNAQLRIYGARNAFLDSVMELARRKGLQDVVSHLGPKSLEEIARMILECDLGIIPNRRSIFTEINTPTRIFEYLSLGKPVIAPQVPGITDYFNEKDMVFFELGDYRDLARQIEFVYTHPDEAREFVERGQRVYLRHNWAREKQVFVDRVSELLTPFPDPI